MKIMGNPAVRKANPHNKLKKRTKITEESVQEMIDPKNETKKNTKSSSSTQSLNERTIRED